MFTDRRSTNWPILRTIGHLVERRSVAWRRQGSLVRGRMLPSKIDAEASNPRQRASPPPIWAFRRWPIMHDRDAHVIHLKILILVVFHPYRRLIYLVRLHQSLSLHHTNYLSLKVCLQIAKIGRDSGVVSIVRLRHYIHLST